MHLDITRVKMNTGPDRATLLEIAKENIHLEYLDEETKALVSPRMVLAGVLALCRSSHLLSEEERVSLIYLEMHRTLREDEVRPDPPSDRQILAG